MMEKIEYTSLSDFQEISEEGGTEIGSKENCHVSR